MEFTHHIFTSYASLGGIIVDKYCLNFIHFAFCVLTVYMLVNVNVSYLFRYCFILLLGSLILSSLTFARLLCLQCLFAFFFSSLPEFVVFCLISHIFK